MDPHANVGVSADRRKQTIVSEPIDIEEEVKIAGWAVAPVEACSFSPIAFFVIKEHADRFVASMEAPYKEAGRYFDLAVIPAFAESILGANTYDDAAGIGALVAVNARGPWLVNEDGDEAKAEPL